MVFWDSNSTRIWFIKHLNLFEFSTVSGDLLKSHPGTFYHYEPLLNFGIQQIRGEPLAEKAITNIKKLFLCNYTEMGKLYIFVIFLYYSSNWIIS